MFIFLKKEEKEFIDNFMRMLPNMQLKLNYINDLFTHAFFIEDKEILKVNKEILKVNKDITWGKDYMYAYTACSNLLSEEANQILSDKINKYYREKYLIEEKRKEKQAEEKAKLDLSNKMKQLADLNLQLLTATVKKDPTIAEAGRIASEMIEAGKIIDEQTKRLESLNKEAEKLYKK